MIPGIERTAALREVYEKVTDRVTLLLLRALRIAWIAYVGGLIVSLAAAIVLFSGPPI